MKTEIENGRAKVGQIVERNFDPRPFLSEAMAEIELHLEETSGHDKITQITLSRIDGDWRGVIETQEPKIYTATISHRHGVNLYHSKSENGLKNQIYGFVAEYWEEEFENDPIPTETDQAIEAYFESASNRGEFVEYFEAVPFNQIPS